MLAFLSTLLEQYGLAQKLVTKVQKNDKNKLLAI